MVAVPQMGNLPQPDGGEILCASWYQAQLYAQVLMGMWIAPSPANRRFAPAHPGHGLRAHGCLLGAEFGNHRLHGRIGGFPQGSPHA
eukprot:8458013-Heterocapsa_arctica.AAC.1